MLILHSPWGAAAWVGVTCCHLCPLSDEVTGSGCSLPGRGWPQAAGAGIYNLPKALNPVKGSSWGAEHEARGSDSDTVPGQSSLILIKPAGH